MPRSPESIEIKVEEALDRSIVRLAGTAGQSTIRPLLACFRELLTREKDIEIDLSGLRSIDARFIGAVVMLRKQVLESRDVALTNAGWKIRTWLRLNAFSFLVR